MAPSVKQEPLAQSSTNAAALALGLTGSGPSLGIEVRTKFPVARIKRIMQADEEVGKVAQVTPVAVCKCSFLFCRLLFCLLFRLLFRLCWWLWGVFGERMAGLGADGAALFVRTGPPVREGLAMWLSFLFVLRRFCIVV
jgi:hypothetical protein